MSRPGSERLPLADKPVVQRNRMRSPGRIIAQMALDLIVIEQDMSSITDIERRMRLLLLGWSRKQSLKYRAAALSAAGLTRRPTVPNL